MEETFAKKPKEGEPGDVIIIGSGPAALTAAIYTTRGAASTLIIAGEKWGGQLMLTTTVDNYPGFSRGILGQKLMEEMRAQAERFGAEFVGEKAEIVDFSRKPFEVTAGGKTYFGKSVIIASGAETRWLDVPGLNKLIGRGVSSCAPCDAPLFKDKKVAVVGGGDAAMEEALTLAKYVSEVTIIHRRDQFRASIAMQKKVQDDPKIKVLWNTEVKEVVGEEKVEKLILRSCKDNTTSEFPVDGIFIAIGHVPATEIFKGKVELDEKGYIKRVFDQNFAIRNEKGVQIGFKYNMATSVEGIFVAGDVQDFQYKQAVTAAGFGCMAAMDALKFLDEVKS